MLRRGTRRLLQSYRMEEDRNFLAQDNNYRTLKAFQKAECIYDVTFYFAHQFLKSGDRTIDQMIQAARSGKQNLAEGNIDGITSREMELRLTNVNRASLHELLLDYEDYLRVRGLEQWRYDDPRCVQTRAFCRAHLDSAIYREKIKERSDETIANIAITLIHQCDALIRGLIEWKKRDFLENGGIKEEMYRARKEWQKRNGAYGKIDNGYYGGSRSNGSYGSYGRYGQNGGNGQRPNWQQPSQPNQTANPSQTTQTSQPTGPTNPTQPSQPSQPTGPANPTQPTQPTQPTTPTPPITPK